MLNGKCILCGSTELRKRVNGVISGDKQVFVKGLSFLTAGSDQVTILCTGCGFYTQHIADQGVLDRVAKKWDRV
jgi:hypothetical protein